MTMRIAILAACASTLVLTATLAHAQSRAGEGFPGGLAGRRERQRRHLASLSRSLPLESLR
jgi:hypothetical protein